MKPIYKKILHVTAAGLLLLNSQGCKNFLDEQPLDTRVEQNFYKTQKDAEEALTAVYDALQWQGATYSSPPMVTDIASDDAFSGGESRSDSPNMISVDQQRILPTNSDLEKLWNVEFSGIYKANLLLQKLPQITASEEFKKRTAAEAKFLRAYFYLDLVRMFENIPLILEPMSGNYCVPQASPKAVFDQIALDLSEAIPDLPAKTLRENQAHATKWAAEALLARAFLFYNGVYKQNLNAGSATIDSKKALQYLEDVIAKSGHDLLGNYGDIFKKTGEFSIESVWEISYSNENPWWDWGYIQGGEGNMQPMMQGPRVDGDPAYVRGWSFAPVTQQLVDAFEDGDPRKEATILSDAELQGTLKKGYQHTGYFSKKYTTAIEYKPANGQLELNWGNNYRSIRFADVLLMAAELDIQTGGTSAQTYYNRIRDRVGMPHKTATLDNIYRERRVELALEGQRYFDLLRRGQTVADQAISIQNSKGPHYDGDQIDFNVKFNTATKGFFPIPQKDVDQCSGTIKQNVGY